MRKKHLLLWAVAALVCLPLHSQAQTNPSGTDLFIQANALLKQNNCEAARQAIDLYNRAMKADPVLKADCDRRILKCQAIIRKKCSANLDLSKEVITIPYQGGEEQVDVIASKKWNVDEIGEFYTTRQGEKSSFIISCDAPNNSTRERTSTLTVKSGDYIRTLKVIQEGRPEYITVNALSLNFPSKGASEVITVESNSNWQVTSVPSWCSVRQSGNVIHITASSNSRTLDRIDDVVIVTPSNQRAVIKLRQAAGEEHLALSQNDIHFKGDGGLHYLKVYTDADNWYIGDYPTWITSVRKIGKDSVCIEASPFITYSINEIDRSGSVQIKTERQTVGVMVTQEPIYKNPPVGPDGRDFSLGISTSYYMPFVSASAGGDYVGSVVDYSLGNSSENASYKSAMGYSFGVFADMRIHNQFFLIAGINFTQIKYKNEFNLSTNYTMPYNSYNYMRGELMNAYKEDYTHTMIEVPIMASYRFKTANFSHLQLDLGPVLNFGLSSKMKFSGNSDSDGMRLFDRFSNDPVDYTSYMHHTAADAEFNLYQPCVEWTESYTTGNVADMKHHDTFTDSPLHRFNWGLRLGAAYEWAGLSFGLYYTMMLSNMTNKGYWDNKRWTVLNESDAVMKGYKQNIHTLEFRLAYTLRYLGLNKKK